MTAPRLQDWLGRGKENPLKAVDCECAVKREWGGACSPVCRELHPLRWRPRSIRLPTAPLCLAYAPLPCSTQA